MKAVDMAILNEVVGRFIVVGDAAEDVVHPVVMGLAIPAIGVVIGIIDMMCGVF